MDKSAKFWNRIAHRYSRHPVSDEAVYTKKLEVTRNYFSPDMEILEFGCGTGTTAISHAPYVKHILAVDFSAKMIEISRGKAAAANINNITFLCSGLDDYSAHDESFDAVLCLNVLHLLKDWGEAIIRVHRMLKPGGVFVTSTPCAGDTIFRLIKFVAPLGQFIGLLPQISFFTINQLEKNFMDAGFVIDYKWLPKKNAAWFIVAIKR
jgi:ubiquinone/menaquinone biosynthesis C-methylase UbiE